MSKSEKKRKEAQAGLARPSPKKEEFSAPPDPSESKLVRRLKRMESLTIGDLAG